MHKRLYLLTLEIVALGVDQAYNPLPSHLTLVSRFKSSLSPDAMAQVLMPIFQHAAPLELLFQETVALGPKRVMAHIVQNTPALRALHEALVNALTEQGAHFAYPEFIGSNHKPHVTIRPNDPITPGQARTTTAAYLIEVTKQGGNDLRHIRHKFNLMSAV